MDRLALHHGSPAWVISTPRARPSGTRPKPTEAESFRAGRAWDGGRTEGFGAAGRVSLRATETAGMSQL
ncbi:hypothetical protein GCM10009738_08880 [Kitasatospora viridis]